SYVERSLKESLAKRKFGRQEMQEIVAFFGVDPVECAFCGSKEVRRWDHLIAVSKDGETVLGNMVPACGRCDDSKQDLPFDEWMRSSAQFSPKSLGVSDLEHRIERIRTYVKRFGYVPIALERRLTPDEASELTKFREKIRLLRL